MGQKGEKIVNRFMNKSGLDVTQKNVAYEIAHKPFTLKTLEEIAIENNICRQTITRWRSQKIFNDEVERYTRELQRSQVTDCIKALETILVNGKDKDKLKAIEIIYKNNGLLKDVQEVTQENNVNISIDDVLKEIDTF